MTSGFESRAVETVDDGRRKVLRAPVAVAAVGVSVDRCRVCWRLAGRQQAVRGGRCRAPLGSSRRAAMRADASVPPHGCRKELALGPENPTNCAPVTSNTNVS